MEEVWFSSGGAPQGFSVAGSKLVCHAAAWTFAGKLAVQLPAMPHLESSARYWLGGSCALSCHAFVHLHARHIHVDLKFDVADFDELPAAIAKFDQHMWHLFLAARWRKTI